METKIKDFVTYCKDYISDNIYDQEGREVYLYDLGLELTERPNCDGSLTYSSALAREYLGAWYREAGDYWQYEKDEFGENLHNPFDNPEAYMVCMVIEGVRSLIDRAISELGLDDQWNECTEITSDLISKILEKVEKDEVTSLF